MQQSTSESAAAFMKRLHEAVQQHDLDALTACFAADYRNMTPAHPARGFVGQAQVRLNWEQIFGAVPDLTADVTWIGDEVVWSEWEMRGTRRDGGAHLMRGVVIFGLNGTQAAWARFYLEPVEVGGGDVNEGVRRNLSGGDRPSASETAASGSEVTR